MIDIFKTSICQECGHYIVSDPVVDTEYKRERLVRIL